VSERGTSRLGASTLGGAGAAILASVALLTAADAAPAAPDNGGGRAPNVIMIVTDDQAAATYSRAYMPRVFGKLVKRGTTFEQSVVATPLCCPSRAVLQTGQYGHNNGVLRNSYDLLDRKQNVLSGWLRRAGYRTIHVGRFYNGNCGPTLPDASSPRRLRRRRCRASCSSGPRK
jgi:hypothetical protein